MKGVPCTCVLKIIKIPQFLLVIQEHLVSFKEKIPMCPKTNWTLLNMSSDECFCKSRENIQEKEIKNSCRHKWIKHIWKKKNIECAVLTVIKWRFPFVK